MMRGYSATNETAGASARVAFKSARCGNSSNRTKTTRISRSWEALSWRLIVQELQFRLQGWEKSFQDIATGAGLNERRRFQRSASAGARKSSRWKTSSTNRSGLAINIWQSLAMPDGRTDGNCWPLRHGRGG